jgi:hypothetical protein
VDISKESSVREGGDSEVVGRVAQREIYGGGETLAPAKAANDASLLEGLTHGLLNEHGRALGKLRKDVDKLRGGNRHIEDGVTWSEAHGISNGAERMRNATLGCERCCFVSILVH